MDLSHIAWQRESKRQAVPLGLSLQLVAQALPWCGGSCEAEPVFSAADGSSQGRSKAQRHPVHAFCLSCLTVSFQSSRNTKEMGGEKTNEWKQ